MLLEFLILDNTGDDFSIRQEDGINVVPYSQLFGGKIIAALDRQHPRNLFDIKSGFMLCLLSSNRPILELLNPIWKDQRQAFENQFEGMTTEPFSYQDFEETRETLVLQIGISMILKNSLR